MVLHGVSSGGGGGALNVIEGLRALARSILGVNNVKVEVTIVTPGVQEVLLAYLPVADRLANGMVSARVIEAQARAMEAQGSVVTALTHARKLHLQAQLVEASPHIVEAYTAAEASLSEAQDERAERVLAMLAELRTGIAIYTPDYDAVVEEPLRQLLTQPRRKCDPWDEWR